MPFANYIFLAFMNFFRYLTIICSSSQWVASLKGETRADGTGMKRPGEVQSIR